MSEALTISVQVNGASLDCPLGQSVSQLLEQLDLSGRRVAVEINQEIVPKDDFSCVVLSPGDVLEIVSFVGGG